MDGNVAVIDSTACILCGQCVEVCPTGAIIDART
jgi:formate hydrogenlyase subunit 6/NADH:ubiquinone oxidoreductase subunit I